LPVNSKSQKGALKVIGLHYLEKLRLEIVVIYSNQRSKAAPLITLLHTYHLKIFAAPNGAFKKETIFIRSRINKRQSGYPMETYP